MNYLDRILVHANTRLMQMTAGQYELERASVPRTSAASQALTWESSTHFHWHPPRVKTLSAASFKASLARPWAFPFNPEHRRRHPAGHSLPR